MFNILHGEVKQTKKDIIGLLKRKKARKKEASADIIPCSEETKFQHVPQTSPNVQSITCPNSKCGNVFDQPLQLIDLADPLAECALVCPYCLSKLEPIQPEQEAVIEAFPSEESQGATKQKEENCPHYFGYLGKRAKNVPVPDFCLTCTQMIECCTSNH